MLIRAVNEKQLRAFSGIYNMYILFYHSPVQKSEYFVQFNISTITVLSFLIILNNYFIFCDFNLFVINFISK